MKLLARSASLALIATALFSQAQPKLEFEVATIKPASMPSPADAKNGRMHVGITIDAQRVDMGFFSLYDLIAIAYRVKRYQVEGPDWTRAARFDIQAKMPDGSSPDQYRDMLRALLEERFKLAVHRESKDHPVYELVVGKSGPKLKEAAADAPSLRGGRGAPDVQNDNKGGSLVNGGALKLEMRPNGVMHYTFAKISMDGNDGIVNFLSTFLDRPVIDKTNLKGFYEVQLDVTRENMMNAARGAGVNVPPPENRAAAADSNAMPADAASDPDGSALTQSLQQLGLKLEARKSPLETIVVDHAEKTPTEN